jgi:adenosylcobinamide-GDP ribazoletransferase
MFKEIKNLITFLTIIPLGMDSDCLLDAANYMYLFPLVGLFIGLLAGLLAWLLFYILPDLVVGILTLGFILLITGLHHTDGLLDFGDGIMFQGSPEKKIKIMHDEHIGAGGLTLGLMILLTTAFCIAKLKAGITVQSLAVSEILAKFAMVVVAWAGKSAHKGMNTYFINAMHGRYRRLRLITALIITVGIIIPLLWLVGLITVIVAFVTSLIMVRVSNRHFGGVTGDVMGATNEITRMATLITFLGMARWM